MWIQQVIFYVFAFMAILSAGVVVTSRNPVISALFLVMTFFAMAGIWLLAHAEFLSLILVLVYVGAVMTLFLFVIMMLNIDVVTQTKGYMRYLPIGLGIVGLMVFLMIVAIAPAQFGFEHLPVQIAANATVSNTEQLGLVLYTDYVYAFEIAAVLLLVAIIAAICLVHQGPRNCKTQSPTDQIKVRREDRVRVLKMAAEKR